MFKDKAEVTTQAQLKRNCHNITATACDEELNSNLPRSTVLSYHTSQLFTFKAEAKSKYQELLAVPKPASTKLRLVLLVMLPRVSTLLVKAKNSQISLQKYITL